VAQREAITLGDVEDAKDAYEAKLDSSFFLVRLDRARQLRIAYMRTMAQLGPDSQKASDAAGRRGRERPTGPNSLGADQYGSVVHAMAMQVPQRLLTLTGSLSRPYRNWTSPRCKETQEAEKIARQSQVWSLKGRHPQNHFRRTAAVKRSHKTADQDPRNGTPDVTAASRLRIFQKEKAHLMVFSIEAGRAFSQHGLGDSWLRRIDLVSRQRRGQPDPPARFPNGARRGPLENAGGMPGCRDARSHGRVGRPAREGHDQAQPG
jgi:hypothetical protein